MSKSAETIVLNLWDKSPSGIMPPVFSKLQLELVAAGFTVPPTGKARIAWGAREVEISLTGYSRHRDCYRAWKRNDIRFARALDALRAEKKAK